MKILFFTGSRSEWGYIRPILELCKRKKIKYEICVSNTHLLPSFGFSLNEIKKDGFQAKHKIFMTLDGYNNFSTSKSLGIFIQSFSDVLFNSKPDWLLLAGDRGETFAASIAGAYSNIPTAHIQAGELSGNIDGMARHAIGKMAHVHFASNKDAYKRLIKLGEEKYRIFETGATQLDDIKNKKYKNRREVEKKFSIKKDKKIILAIFHPVTEDQSANKRNLINSIKVLNNIDEQIIWILPNSDSGSKDISDLIFENTVSNSKIYRNVSRDFFLGLMAIADCMIGNSSAGLLEAPSFNLPSINLGRRQNKRLRGKNVIDLNIPTKNIISLTLNRALKLKSTNKFANIKNPYGNGNSSEKILKILNKLNNNKHLLYKNLEY